MKLVGWNRRQQHVFEAVQHQADDLPKERILVFDYLFVPQCEKGVTFQTRIVFVWKDQSELVTGRSEWLNTI
jgi:hypothetical protein